MWWFKKWRWLWGDVFFVYLQALVTPCLPKCEPVQCDVQDYLGYQRQIDSMGRRRRRVRRDVEAEDLLVVQTIRIADKFQVPYISNLFFMFFPIITL